jgi:hypothetical protein
MKWPETSGGIAQRSEQAAHKGKRGISAQFVPNRQMSAEAHEIRVFGRFAVLTSRPEFAQISGPGYKIGLQRRAGGISPLSHFCGNPSRIAAQIERRANQRGVVLDLIIDGVGKAFGEEAIKPSELDGVNSGVKLQGVDVGRQRVEKIGPQSFFLPFVESITSSEIVDGCRLNRNPHSISSRSCRLAISQSRNFSSPDSVSRSRSARSSPCQAGEARFSDDRSVHRSSINRNFSATVICRRSSVWAIRNL